MIDSSAMVIYGTVTAVSRFKTSMERFDSLRRLLVGGRQYGGGPLESFSFSFPMQTCGLQRASLEELHSVETLPITLGYADFVPTELVKHTMNLRQT